MSLTTAREQYKLEFEKERESLIKDGESKAAEIVSLQDRVQVLETEIDEAHTALEKEKDELESKLELAGAAIKIKNNEIDELTDTITWSNDQIVQLKAEASSLSEEKDNLVSKAEEDRVTAEHREFALEQVRYEKNELSVKLEESNATIQRSTDEIDGLNKEVLSSNDQVVKLKSQVSTLSKEKDELATKADGDRASFEQCQVEHLEQVNALVERIESVEFDRDVAHIELEEEHAIRLDVESEKDDYAFNLEDANMTIKKKTAWLNEAITSANAQILHLKTLVQEKDSLMNKLEDAVAGLEEAAELDKASFNELEAIHANEVNALEERLKRKTAEMISLEERIKMLETDGEARQVTITKLTASNDSLETERTELIQNLELTVSKLESVSSTLKEAHGELANVKAERQQLECQVNDLKKTASHDKESSETSQRALNDEIEELREKFQVAQIDALKIKTDLTDEVTKLSSQLSESQNETRQVKALCSDLKSKLNTAESLLDEGDAEIKNLFDDCERLEKEAKDLQDVAEKMEDEVTRLKHEKQALTDELDDITACRDKVQDDKEFMVDKLKSESDSLNENISFLTNDVKLKDAKVKDLLVKLEKSQSDASRFETEGQSLGENISVLTNDVTLKGAEVKDLMVKLDKSQSEASQSKALSADLKSRLESKETTLGRANAENSALTNNCDRFSKQANDLNMLLENADEDLLKKNDEIKSLTVELNSEKALTNNLVREKDALAAEFKSNKAKATMLSDRVQELIDQISKGDTDKTELLSKITSLEIDLVMLNSQLEAKDSSLKSKQDDNASLRSQVQELKANVEVLSGSMNQAESHFNIQCENYEAQEKELLVKKKDLEMTVQKLTTQVQEVKAQARRDELSHEVNQKQLIDDIRDLQNAVSGTKIKCNHLTDELKACQYKNSELELTVEDARRSESEFTSKEKELNALLSTRESELQRSKIGHQDASTRSDTMSSTIISKEQEIDSLKNRLTSSSSRLEATIKSKQQEIDDLKKELTSSKEITHEKVREMQHSLEAKQGEIDGLTIDLDSAKTSHEHSKSNLDSIKGEFMSYKESTHEKIREMQHALEVKQNKIDRLAVDLDSAKTSHEQLKSKIDKVNSAHNDDRSELQQRMACLTTEFEASTREVDNLRRALLEGVSLNSSMREKDKAKERVFHEQCDKIEQLKAELQSMGQNMAQAESAFTSEKKHLMKLIDMNQATAESDKGLFVAELDRANEVEVALRSKLQDTQLELAQLSMDLACTREEVVVSVTEAKSATEEAIHHLANKSGVEKNRLQREFDSLNVELLRQQEKFHSELSEQDKRISFLRQEHEEAITQLNDTHEQQVIRLEEASLLNKSLSNRLELSSTLDQRDDKLTKMLDTVKKMDRACAEYCADDPSKEAELTNLSNILQSRNKAVDHLTEDLAVAQKSVTGLTAEVERVKREKASFQLDWSSLQSALYKLVACIQHDDMDMSVDELPEMSSLLDTLFELFQAKVDQVSTLTCQIEGLHSSNADRAMEVEHLLDEINSLQERIAPLLACHDEIIKSDSSRDELNDCKALMNTIEHELRDICIQLDVQINQDDSESSLSQPEVIHCMLQSLNVTVASGTLNPKSDALLHDDGDDLLVDDFLSEIEQAKQRVEHLGHKRKHYKYESKSRGQTIEDAAKTIKDLEEQIKVMDETALMKIQKIKNIESQFEQAQQEKQALEVRVNDLSEQSQTLEEQIKVVDKAALKQAQEIKAVELQLEHAEQTKHALEDMSNTLQTRNKTIDRLTEDLATAREKVVGLTEEMKDTQSQLKQAKEEKRALEMRVNELSESSGAVKEVEFRLQQAKSGAQCMMSPWAKFSERKSERNVRAQVQDEVESCQTLAIELKTIIIEKVRQVD